MLKKKLLRSHEYFEAGFPLVLMTIDQGAMAEHAHDFYEMVYVRRGRGTHVIEGAPYPIRAGDFYFLRPNEAHSYLPDGPLKLVNILWQPALVREILRAEATLDFLKPLLRSRAKQTVFRRLHLSGGAAFRVENLLDEMQREFESTRADENATGSHALLRHLFCALLILLARAGEAGSTPATATVLSSEQSAAQNTVARAIAYLESHAAETVRVPEVAAHVALSAGRLAHLFKAQTGRSVIEYLHELRLEKVCLDLRESDLPIGEIAGVAGYNDARFFHRVFRRHAGCSPTQYRARFLQGSE
jgi:AraC-like DNA-binding protein/quercetin dioxygenase-like cupin family protein